MTRRPREVLKRMLAPQTRGFARDSLKLSAASAVVVGSYGLQIALITHVLGLDEFGVFAVVVAFVDLIARLLDFQVGQMTMTFAAGSVKSNPRRVVGIAQFSYLIDAGAGLVGFCVISALATFASAHLLDGEYSAWLFVLYGLTVLVTTTETTSIALLQVTGKYTIILRLTIVREVLGVGFVVGALLISRSLAAVIIALVAMEACLAVLWTAAASRAVRGVQVDGGGLWRPSFTETDGLRGPMARMVFHTNVISYVKVAAAQAPTLLLGAMRPPADAGAFKVGTAIAAVVGKPADPAWAAILPRLSRLVEAGRRSEITTLIRQSSLGVGLAISTLGLVAIVFRDPLLRLVGGQQALVAGAVWSSACWHGS